VYYTSIASVITLDYFKTCLYHDDPLSGRQRVETSVGRRCQRGTCGCRDAVTCR